MKQQLYISSEVLVGIKRIFSTPSDGSAISFISFQSLNPPHWNIHVSFGSLVLFICESPSFGSVHGSSQVVEAHARSHQTFREIARNRCRPTTLHTITARDTDDGWC